MFIVRCFFLTTLVQLVYSILNGKEVAIRHFPHSVAIFKCKEFICTGIVLKDDLVLSSASCFMLEVFMGKPYNSSRLIIKAGHEKLSKMPVARNVRKAIIHHCFSINHLRNNIALLFLTRKLPFGDTIKPVFISKTRINVNQAKVAGWGFNRNKSHELTKHEKETLKYESDTVYSQNKCCALINKYMEILENGIFREHGMFDGYICAGDRRKTFKGLCWGDSGSALTVHYKNKTFALGIYSVRLRGPHIIVFTNLTHYYNWIMRNIDENS